MAFVSAADNLSPDDTDGYPDIFVNDLRTGELSLVSRAADGTKAATGVGSVRWRLDRCVQLDRDQPLARRYRREFPRLRQAAGHWRPDIGRIKTATGDIQLDRTGEST